MRFLTLLFSLIFTHQITAQVSLAVGQTVTINFESTVAGVHEGTFTGAGVATTPTPGQLDTDAFAFTGFEPTALGRGISGAGVTAGGVYAFMANGSTALGFQPDADNFTPGTVTITAVNDGATAIGGVDFSAIVCLNNDTPSSSAYGISYSLDGTTFTSVGNPILTLAGAFPFSFFACNSTGNQSISGINIPPGGSFFLRFSGDDVGTITGGRDEIAFDDIVFTPTAVVLPVSLTHFAAEATAGRVQLNWQTAREVNNDYFRVERSLDGETFETIGMVQGNGTTDATTDYRFVDEAPAAGINYYRLTQTDYDGTSETFAVRSVTMGTKGDATVFPNPVRESVTVAFPDEVSDADLQVHDLSGRLVLRQNCSGLQAELDLSALQAGTYLLRMNTGTALTVERLVKL